MSDATFQNQYSLLDRALHRLAFRTTGVQVEMADLEDRLLGSRIRDVEIQDPVFVTALPRAGTTLLLELLVGSGAFASHTYRDMPFVLTPLLWARFSAAFRTEGVAQERAHGDGMTIGPDSPEAFEEIVWRAHWRDRYREDRILPWERPAPPSFTRFFSRHVRKIVALRGGAGGGGLRYLSKNNLNVSRLDCLLGMLPESRVLVPVRDPLQHARSSLRQHRRFLEIHARDRFGRAYMEGVGHYDFGENLRPVDFDGWVDRAGSPDPTTLAWWVEYWRAAYRHLLGKVGPRVHFVSYEALCDDPEEGLGRLAEHLGLEAGERAALLGQAERIDAPRRAEVDTGGLPTALREEVAAIHREARAVSLV